MLSRLLEPSLYARARLPLTEAETLPPWCYTSDEFHEEEVRQIFRRTWCFAGRVDEIPKAGDFMTLELNGESIIIVRDQSSAVRAFANTCRHRGTRLVAGKGHCAAFSCPYHAWTFGLGGELRGAPGMEGVEGFDKSQYGLVPVRLETWGGFMFICLDWNAPPLQAYLGNAVEVFGSYRFEDMIVVRRKEYDLACNWKLYIENAMEDYHTATVHHVSIGKQVCTQQETTGAWDAIHMPATRTVAILPGETTTFPHIPSLKGKAAEGTFFAVVYPNWFFAATHDCMWWLHAQPKGAGRSIITHGACFPRATAERPDFAEVVQRYFKRWEKSLPEDNEIAELQQAGLKSSFSRPGRLSLREPCVHAMGQWVLDHVLGGGPQLRPQDMRKAS
jgi:phenylpropionate dioxygenase-like ring-hydroxylating dioxygenase large terminal subunit